MASLADTLHGDLVPLSFLLAVDSVTQRLSTTVSLAVTCASIQDYLLLRQERARELAAHEEQLEEWKKRFKAEALRKIGEREQTLADWQAQLEGSRSELEHLKENVEVRMLRQSRDSLLGRSSQV